MLGNQLLLKGHDNENQIQLNSSDLNRFHWHTISSCIPVKPPKAQSVGFVKGDDTKEVFSNWHQTKELLLEWP
ncbi:MAG TPA: hypothetical protein PK563_15500 [Tenuifilaceae bacterium]|nr:hypothetical protein [Tenuifilaceae bacterium]